MISTCDHRSDTLSNARNPTPHKPFAVSAGILLWELLNGQCRPWRADNSLPKDERLNILKQIVKNVDNIVIQVNGPYQHSFKSSEPTSRIFDITLPPGALETLRDGVHIYGSTSTSHLQSITTAGYQRGSSSRRGNQSPIPLPPARNNSSGSSRNRKERQKQKDGLGEDRTDPTEQTDSADSGTIGKPNTVQCSICRYDPSPGEKSIYSGPWFNVGRHIEGTHLKEYHEQKSLKALTKLRWEVKNVCTETKQIEKLENLLLHPVDLHGRRRKFYDSRDRLDHLPKDSNPGIGAGTAYQIGKQLNSEFNARGCDQAQIICSFIAGLSKDARQRLGNVISGAENTEATGTTSTGKRKRDPDDMPKSPAAAPSKRRSPKTGPLPDSVGPSKAVPISQIGDTSLGRDSSAKISPRTDQSEGHMQPSREEGEISTLECNLSQGEHFLREMNYLWDGGDTYGLTDDTSVGWPHPVSEVFDGEEVGAERAERNVDMGGE